MIFTVAPATTADIMEWGAMRKALWPHHDIAELVAEAPAMLADMDGLVLIARDEAGAAVGLAEAALRHDYVNGCKTSPVAFLEGIYVAPAHRRLGIATALVARIQDWARAGGCSEFASDAALDNSQSHAMHHALGFAETQRVVYFRKVLG